MAEKRYTIVFGVAVLVAGLATLGVWRVLQSAEAANRVRTVPVVVANRDIPEGYQIELSAVTRGEWPVQTVPAGAFTTLDSGVGRVVRIPVFKGDPIVPGRLAPAGTGPGLEVKISPGKRAMALRINDVAGISGLIQPNSRVDVVVTMRSPDGRGGRTGQVAKVFMENMRVLSVGTQTTRLEDGTPADGKIATLEVTPEEAERLAVAQQQGAIQLVLRGYGDPDSINTSGATSGDVLDALREGRTLETPDPAPVRRTPVRRPPPKPEVKAPPVVVETLPPPKPLKPDSSTVKVYRGGQMTTQKFEKDTLVKKPM
jgi:pilus assembly protein CpaB